MRYEIAEYDRSHGMVTSMIVKSTKTVEKEVKGWKKQDHRNSIFVSFFRASDGQHGYYNPDGNHEITGRAW